MKEEWRHVEGFPNYLVSNFGGVYNIRSKNERKPCRSQHGVAMVTISLDSRLYTKAVPNLVAEAFIREDRDIYNTVICLDGDRMNCHIDNLMWRPRWFAIKYHRQFTNPWFHRANQPLEMVSTKEVYEAVRVPAVKYGLLAYDIDVACRTDNRVFPIGQAFRYLDI